MIRHIVMIKISERSDIQDTVTKLKLMLENLQFSVEPLINMEVGANISTKPSAFDIVLTADFKDKKGLDDYRVHPEHIKVLDFLKIVMEKAAVVDYII